MKASTPTRRAMALVARTVAAPAKATFSSGTISRVSLYSGLLIGVFACIVLVSPAAAQQISKDTVLSQGWTVTAEMPVSVGADQIQGRVTFVRYRTRRRGDPDPTDRQGTTVEARRVRRAVPVRDQLGRLRAGNQLACGLLPRLVARV